MEKNNQKLSTKELIKKLNAIADELSTGLIVTTLGALTPTKDGVACIRQAADRLFELDERIAMMTEDSADVPPEAEQFPGDRR